MELEFQAYTMPYLRQTLSKTQNCEETADMVVPDSLPDIDRIVLCSADVMMRSKQCSGGAVTVSGGIHADVLYCAQEDPEPRRLEVYLPFTVKTDAPDVSDDAQIQFRAWIRSADARMINSRKISVCVNFGCELQAYQPDEITLYQPPEVPENIQLRCCEYPMDFVVDAGEKPFRMTEEVQLPATNPLGDLVLCCKPELEITEQRLAGNKAAFKGLAHISLLYMDENGNPIPFETRFPFSQFCELGAVYDGESLWITPIITGCEVERVTHADQDALSIDLHILAQCTVVRKTNVTLCEDAYAIGGRLKPCWADYTFTDRLDRQTNTYSVREGYSGDVREVLCTQVLADTPEVRRVEGGVEVAVPCTAELLYYDGEGQLQGASVHARAAEKLLLAENADCGAAVENAECSASVSADGAEIRVTMQVCAQCRAQREYRAIKSFEYTPEETPQRRRCAVIARRLRDGETLWEIAKANGTSVQAICDANGLDGDAAETDMLLLIPIS